MSLTVSNNERDRVFSNLISSSVVPSAPSDRHHTPKHIGSDLGT